MQNEVKSDSEHIDLIKVIVGAFKYKIHILGMRHRAESMLEVADIEKMALEASKGDYDSPIQFSEKDSIRHRQTEFLGPLFTSTFGTREGKPLQKDLEIFKRGIKVPLHVQELFKVNYERLKGDSKKAEQFLKGLKKKTGVLFSPIGWALFLVASLKVVGKTLPELSKFNLDELEKAFETLDKEAKKAHLTKVASEVCDAFTMEMQSFKRLFKKKTRNEKRM